MSVLQRFLTSSDKLKKEDEPEPCEEIEEGQPHNPYTEILILQHHSDIVRLLLRISDKRFVSAGDDGKAVVWDVQYGRRIATLLGHTHPITSLLLLTPMEENDDSIIVSASSDKQIRLWKADTGECLHTLTEHGTSVRCLLLLNHGLFCAGGENLSIWNRRGTHLHSIPNSAEEDIHLMTSIKYDRLVAAADKALVVYKLDVDNGYELSKDKEMNSHHEAIRALIPISTSSFAGGSVDGMIIIWIASTLQPAKVLYANKEGTIQDRIFQHSIQAMMCIQERYLFAAIGCGFCVYDVSGEKGTIVIQKKTAHWSQITSMGFACEGEFLATCSEDKCLRLWGHKPSLDPWKDGMAVTTMERFSGLQPHELGKVSTNGPWEPVLLGECCAHGGSVQGFLDFDHEGIVTCGSDGLVIVWKNLEMQKVRRNQLVRKLLKNVSYDGIV